MDVVNRVTVILTVIIGLTTTMTTTIPSIRTTMVAILPCIPITDIPIHLTHIIDPTATMAGMGIVLIAIVTQRRARRLVS